MLIIQTITFNSVLVAPEICDGTGYTVFISGVGQGVKMCNRLD